MVVLDRNQTRNRRQVYERWKCNGEQQQEPGMIILYCHNMNSKDYMHDLDGMYSQSKSSLLKSNKLQFNQIAALLYQVLCIFTGRIKVV